MFYTQDVDEKTTLYKVLTMPTRQEISATITRIGQLNSVEEIRTELATFGQDLDNDYATHEQTLTQVQTLTDNNERLRRANLDLFLKIGTNSSGDNKDDTHQDGQTKDLKFEDLFNEKGELK